MINAKEARRRSDLVQGPPTGFPSRWATEANTTIERAIRKEARSCKFTPSTLYNERVSAEAYARHMENFAQWLQDLGFVVKNPPKTRGIKHVGISWEDVEAPRTQLGDGTNGT